MANEDPIALRTRGRRVRTLATLAPLLGLFLLMPPFILPFAQEAEILGAPLVVVYIFAVWAVLILSARVIARRIAQAPEEESDG